MNRLESSSAVVVMNSSITSELIVTSNAKWSQNRMTFGSDCTFYDPKRVVFVLFTGKNIVFRRFFIRKAWDQSLLTVVE